MGKKDIVLKCLSVRKQGQVKLRPEEKYIVNITLKMIEEVMNMRYRVFLYNVPEEIEAPDKETAEATLMELLSKAFWLLPVTEYSSAKQRSDGQENKMSEGVSRAG